MHNFIDVVATIKALIEALLKNNYDPQRCLVRSEKNYFRPLGALCLEKCLRIRAQLQTIPVRFTMAEVQQAKIKV